MNETHHCPVDQEAGCMAAAEKPYGALLDAHVKDYRALFRRVALLVHGLDHMEVVEDDLGNRSCGASR